MEKGLPSGSLAARSAQGFRIMFLTITVRNMYSLFGRKELLPAGPPPCRRSNGPTCTALGYGRVVRSGHPSDRRPDMVNIRLRPRQWATFQHYKGRRPPWIKLRRALLEQPQWHWLPDASKALAPMLWLLAGHREQGGTGETVE